MKREGALREVSRGTLTFYVSRSLIPQLFFERLKLLVDGAHFFHDLGTLLPVTGPVEQFIPPFFQDSDLLLHLPSLLNRFPGLGLLRLPFVS